jgi:hypothetical protein
MELKSLFSEPFRRMVALADGEQPYCGRKYYFKISLTANDESEHMKSWVLWNGPGRKSEMIRASQKAENAELVGTMEDKR